MSWKPRNRTAPSTLTATQLWDALQSVGWNADHEELIAEARRNGTSPARLWEQLAALPPA